MIRTSWLLAFFCLTVARLSAQTPAVSGQIVDAATGESLVKATAQLYVIRHSDTTLVAGTVSDAQGRFSLGHVRGGTYLLRVSYLGYKPKEQRVTTTAGRTLQLGKIRLDTDALLLKETVVTANLPKMVVKDDTVVYNADAFTVPEGAVTP